MFLLEDADSAERQGRRPRAEILSARFAAFHAPRELRPTLVRCIRQALEDAGVSPSEVRLAAPSDSAGGPAGIEAQALTEALDGTEVQLVRVRDLFGDASAASAAFQLAAVLAVGRAAPGGDGVALVTSVDGDGLVACTAVRLL